MRVLKPVSITDDLLISSSIPESDYPLWSATASYAIGARVIRTEVHKVYEALVSGVDATHPEDAIGGSTPRWLEIGPTNRWALFDNQISTETAANGSIQIVIKPGIINSVALIGVVARRVSVSMVYDGDTVYDESRNLDKSEISNWYQYFFAGFELIDQAVFTGLPPFADAEVTITIEGSDIVSCGALLVGTSYYLGKVKYSPAIEITDYSVKQTDVYGVTTFVKRQYAKKMEAALMVENNRINAVFARVGSLRATPSVWMTSEKSKYDLLAVFGWYELFSVTIPYKNYSLCTLQIQGLT